MSSSIENAPRGKKKRGHTQHSNEEERTAALHARAARHVERRVARKKVKAERKKLWGMFRNYCKSSNASQSVQVTFSDAAGSDGYTNEQHLGHLFDIAANVSDDLHEHFDPLTATAVEGEGGGDSAVEEEGGGDSDTPENQKLESCKDACKNLLHEMDVAAQSSSGPSSRGRGSVSLARAVTMDAVITWVDTSDRHWQKAKEAATTGASSSTGTIPPPSESKERYQPAEEADTEIHLALELMVKNCEFRTIHVVTMRPQIPQCLQRGDLGDAYSRGKIVVVHHDEFIDAKFLPTFNSHCIESYLHHIPNLAECFLYSNDDTYITKEVQSHAFFRRVQLPDGSEAFHMKLRGWEMKKHSLQNSMHSQAISNDVRVCKHMKLKAFHPSHQVSPMLKSVMMIAELFFGETWKGSRTTFRGDKNIVPMYAASSLAYATGKGQLVTPESDDITAVCIHGHHFKMGWKKKELPHLLCVNSLSDERKIRHAVDRIREGYLWQ